ncbi:MAG: ATP-binding protein [Phycisphaeraceae bacterium]|nr:MAG: ATP-binding protein [Phycisphaeraceae bacterium]
MGAGPTNAPEEMHFELVNDRSAIDRAETDLVRALEERDYPKASHFAVRLAFEEAVMNALRHGHRDIPETPVEVHCRVDRDRVRIVIEDQGPGFDPDDVPDPTLDENIEGASGRGLLLIRAYMASVEFEDSGRRCVMVYERPDPPAG